MFASVFDTFVVQPIFNLLVAIYALIPGHNFGLAIILFTIVVRLLMWPLVKKQLHQAKAMREMQPDIKRIKESTKGNRQKESLMLMELYKEKGISPFGSIGILIVQLIIFIGLYQGLVRVVADPRAVIDNAYAALQNLSWLKQLGSNINLFDSSLLGVVDLTRAAVDTKAGTVYIPALLLVIGSTIAQYYQSKQLMPQAKDARSLRHILKDASAGKQADNSEVQAATGRLMLFFLPFIIFTTTLFFASALSLYWMVGGIVAIIQQSKILKQDETEMEVIADKPGDGTRIIIDGEVIKDTTSKKPKVAAQAVATKTKKAKTAKTVKGKSAKRRK